MCCYAEGCLPVWSMCMSVFMSIEGWSKGKYRPRSISVFLPSSTSVRSSDKTKCVCGKDPGRLRFWSIFYVGLQACVCINCRLYVCEHVNMWLVWLPVCVCVYVYYRVCACMLVVCAGVNTRVPMNFFVYLGSLSTSINQYKQYENTTLRCSNPYFHVNNGSKDCVQCDRGRPWQTHRELSLKSAFPFTSVGCFNIFQLVDS